jgi:hypothetical protein
VGSTVTITITGVSTYIVGDYEVIWSAKPMVSDSTEYVVVAKGKIPQRTNNLSVTFTVPEAPMGNNYVQIRLAMRTGTEMGYLNDVPYVGYASPFAVLPDFKLVPASISPGSKVTLQGTGFPASRKVTLTFDGKELDLNVSTNDKGTFITDFILPPTIAGRHEFKASAETMLYGSELVAALQVVPGISLAPERPGIGDKVTLTGSGFAANSQVTVKYDDILITEGAKTDVNGSFSHEFQVPETRNPRHKVIATDRAGNSATFELPLEGEPPPTPTPLHPTNQRFGWFGTQTVTFKWEPVEDPSGVSYIVEVGTTPRVFPPVVAKEGITGNTWSVKLKPGTYYWRVRAVDGCGNMSDWESTYYAFHVGFFSGWMLVIVAIVLLILFILALRAFFRRLSEYLR